MERRRFLSAGVGAIGAGRLGLSWSRRPPDFRAEFGEWWRRAAVYTAEIAEQMPEVIFDFRPTPDVRSFKEQLLGTRPGARRTSRPPTTAPHRHDQLRLRRHRIRPRDSTIDAVVASFAWVASGLGSVTDATLNEEVPWQGRHYRSTTMPRRGVYVVMRNHVTHHRAQLALHLRLNGIAPVSYVD